MEITINSHLLGPVTFFVPESDEKTHPIFVNTNGRLGASGTQLLYTNGNAVSVTSDADAKRVARNWVRRETRFARTYGFTIKNGRTVAV